MKSSPKFLFLFFISIIVAIVTAYYGSVFVMPSITIVNKSGKVVEQIEVALPSSNLNFGALMDGEKNTLHYSLEQSDGFYNYQFKSKNLSAFRGSCGDVTNYEIHKRVVITLNKNNKIECD